MLARAQRKRSSEVSVPAPVGGLNTISSGTSMPATDCVASWNLIGAEYGLRSRLGWKEHVTGLPSEVRSLPCFRGSTADGSTSKLFACCEDGIYDCSASTDTPVADVTFGTQDTDSGFGEHSAFTNLAGAHFLLYCDESNGYYTYAESGGTWTKVTQGAGATQVDDASHAVDPTKFVQVVVHQNRCWFVEKDSQRAWYSDLNALYGTLVAFNFGSHFPNGGDLRCLATWSIDGGSGPASRLVAISGGGDAVIYEGTDPSSADTWQIVGTWFVGAVPAGRRITTNIGGDVAVMSSIGILPLSKLVLGNPIIDRSQYATLKIANLFNQLQAATANLRGWTMRLHPQDAALIVLVPTAEGQAAEPLVMSMSTRGWHRYRDIPFGLCAEPWLGDLYFGTSDGRVCINSGYLDGVTLADPNAYSPIDCELLTAFSDLGSAVYKRVQQIRVRVISDGGDAQLNAEARYGFDFTSPAAPGSVTATGSSAWDVGLWDSMTWGGAYTPKVQIFGAFGLGVEAAIAFRMRVLSRCVLTGFDVSYDAGGFL